jgi:hypothetical protein
MTDDPRFPPAVCLAVFGVVMLLISLFAQFGMPMLEENKRSPTMIELRWLQKDGQVQLQYRTQIYKPVDNDMYRLSLTVSDWEDVPVVEEKNDDSSDSDSDNVGITSDGTK